MKRILSIITIISATFLSSCSTYYEAYLRNLTNETALVDVFLINKQNMLNLPYLVGVANEVVGFKAGLRWKFDSRQPVRWSDTSHFTFELKPQTSANFTDMIGSVRNGSPQRNMRVIIITKTGSDTLIPGAGYFPISRKFLYEHYGLSHPLLYYDVK